jgi:hypothetical protein
MGKGYSVLDNAFKIAKSDLRDNYSELGIYAGPVRHKEYWARDSFIASLGVCALGDLEQVKKNLNLFTKFQREDGHVPARVEERFHSLRALGMNIKHKTPRALHKQSQPWASEVIDSNSWYLISVSALLHYSKDKVWFLNNKDSIKKVAEWLEKKITRDGLIFEHPTSGWSDWVIKDGYILYNNVLAWKALTDIAKYLDKDGTKYSRVAGGIKKAVKINFWDDNLGYFIDRIDEKGKKYKYFMSDGNLLAVWFGLADGHQGKLLFDYIDSNNLSNVPVPTAHPRLDWKNQLINRLLFPMYVVKNTFTWWGCVSALARVKISDRKGAVEDLRKVAEKIVEYGTCHEVLTPDGKPVDLWFYKSEKQIAWTAGMYIYAFNVLKKGGVI